MLQPFEQKGVGDMSLTVLTTLEILTNPSDLEFIITSDEQRLTYGYLICRGPKHKCKILVNQFGVSKSRLLVVLALRKLLIAVVSTDLETLKLDVDLRCVPRLDQAIVDKLMSALISDEHRMVVNSWGLVAA